FDDFEIAAEANNWVEEVEEENEADKTKSSYYLFIDQFTSKAQQHQWQMELYELQQKDTEKVDVYATKFQKLLSQVNVDNGFSKGFIMRMFLKGLKGNNAELVNIAAPKNLKML
ncbi:8558_t:CDS:2, partial [Gigaspora rosea]